MSPERVSIGEEGRGHIPCKWAENKKGEGTDSGESDTKNLKVNSRLSETAERTGGGGGGGGGVKLKACSHRDKTEQRCERYIYSRQCYRYPSLSR